MRARGRGWPAPAAVLLAAGLVWWAAPGPWRGDPEPPAAGPPRSGEVAVRLQSRADRRPPEVVIDRRERARGGGLIFLTPRAGAAREVPGHQQGPMIVDDRGRVVWFEPPPDGQPAIGLRVQEYRGEPVLTWWQGTIPSRGSGAGEGLIVDRSYRRVATVRAGNGYSMDLHEFLLTPRGTALVTVYARARRDLRDVGGPRDGQVTEGIVQEIDVETGRVLFEWHSLDHVAPSESFREPPESAEQSYDYFHVNSIEEGADGHLLISARHTSAIYKVDRGTGEVLWRLGGKRSDFAMAPGTGFAAQHDARYDGGEDHVRIFDNAAEDEDDQQPSNVKLLRLDFDAMTATLASRLDHPEGLWAESQANAQRAEDGGLFVGWGSLGSFGRFDRDGRPVLAGHLPQGYDSYRAHMDRWTGMPRTRPSIAARPGTAGRVTVFASWSGATEVHRWQVLSGPRPGRLRPAGAPRPWEGLETAIETRAAGRYVAVRALDRAGRTLATSRAVRPVASAPP